MTTQPTVASSPSKIKTDFIPVAIPLLGEDEAQAAAKAVMSGWVSQGPEVAAFENEFAAHLGSAHACAVSNCTTALHLALLAANVGPGDEVITVSHSFIATANVIRYCHATPVFVDIEMDTFNIDPSLIAQAITPRTKAILCVHQLGMPCDMQAILKTGATYGLPVIEDAACAIGSEIHINGQWQPIGRPHGDIACFSFHPRKVITTGDGGMLITSNAQQDQQFRLWRQHGMSLNDSVRHQAATVLFENYPVVGYNYRLTDIQAAIGRKQLLRLPDIIKRRRQLAALYTSLFADIPEVTPPHEPAWARSNWQSYAIKLTDSLDQKQIMQALLDKGIATRRGVMCSHREEAYADVPLLHNLPNSESAQDHTILLPIYPQLREEDVIRIVGALKQAIKSAN